MAAENRSSTNRQSDHWERNATTDTHAVNFFRGTEQCAAPKVRRLMAPKEVRSFCPGSLLGRRLRGLEDGLDLVQDFGFVREGLCGGGAQALGMPS